MYHIPKIRHVFQSKNESFYNVARYPLEFQYNFDKRKLLPSSH
ncbi:hypothetical protein LEP1GSC125_4272 [Leptospira mayottensis 200901122]|uniref:Uncharacterized protein n=1 Tax=Leptospira mayottensis 200901122 TaxID=1193010 RepID=A0AA87MTF9_9LEPT|nr:hypothetical protein LEP1GSC125_4272 [Leptospira mayottensis 200901122]